MAARRIFAAIDISDEVRSRITEYANELRNEFPDVKARWERPEKFHITLRFEPAADEALLRRLVELIKATARKTARFELVVTGTGYFVNRRGPTVLWLGIDVNREGTAADPLAELAHSLSSDNAKPTEKFNPHLTIARIKDGRNVHDLIERHNANSFSPYTFKVDEITLYESILEPSGSTYEVLLRETLTE